MCGGWFFFILGVGAVQLIFYLGQVFVVGGVGVLLLVFLSSQFVRHCCATWAPDVAAFRGVDGGR